jgi:hypothetical protein
VLNVFVYRLRRRNATCSRPIVVLVDDHLASDSEGEALNLDLRNRWIELFTL